MTKQQYKEPTSPLYKALVSKLKEQCDCVVPNKNVTVTMSMEELVPIFGEENFNEKLMLNVHS